jgi:hypothetical protein
VSFLAASISSGRENDARHRKTAKGYQMSMMLLDGACVESAEPGGFNWKNAVTEGRAIVAELDHHVAELDHQWWRLAQLADRVRTSYGEDNLNKFAAEIGAVPCTLGRRLSTYRAWKEIQAAPPKSYAVAQALQAHPDRAKIIMANPEITTAEARELMRDLKVENEGQTGTLETKRWFKSLVGLAEDIVGQANLSAMTPEKRQNLIEVIEPKLLVTLREGGEALVKLADHLSQLVEQESYLTEE